MLPLIPFVIVLALLVVLIAAQWKVFVKAGRPGWGALIPIYNMYLWLKVAGRPGWWVILMLIPIVNLVISIMVSIDVAKAFGRSTGFGVFLFFLAIIAVPILGFGDSKYAPPSPAPAPV